ncbi:MAG: hypothetical protein GY711_28715 [bacterium]|nr:hypothetical protein [bacterium]
MMHLGKNAVIVLALVAAGFFVAWMRFRPYLGSEGRYTDGVRTYDVSDAGEVRYAVWDRPESFPGDVNSGEHERRPALSPDGRVLVFVVGERGLGADLYMADMVDGQAVDVRPLAALNSSGDEWSPAFGPGGLYFASDRPGTAGGLDLWRATYSFGSFGEPERLQGGINSSAHDTDPAPIPGSDGLIFASSRRREQRRDFDLFVARPRGPVAAGAEQPAEPEDEPEDEPGAESEPESEPGGAWSVERLDTLCTAFDEREPAFTADGRNLFFASDRSGGVGGFDLYRSAMGSSGWVRPELLSGVNTAASERDPLPSRDGFELLFTVEEVTQGGAVGTLGGADLVRARSLELFRTPGRPVGWKDLLILGLLLLLAILAWLAKQWEQLEALYKCVLISLVAHLLLMWWFRDVYPEGGEYELRGDSNRIRVRLVSNPAGGSASNAERGGELEVARAEALANGAERREVAHAETASAAAPAKAALERARADVVAAPTREVAEPLERAAEPAVEAPALRAATESFERLAQAAPSLNMSEPGREARTERAHADARRSEATRAQDATPSMQSVVPSEWTQERAENGPELPSAPLARNVEHAPTHTAETGSKLASVAEPSESIERLEGSAPVLALEAGTTAAERERSTPEAPRSDDLGAASPDVLEATTAQAAQRSQLEVSEQREAQRGPAAEALELERAAPDRTDVALAQEEREAFERMTADSSVEGEALFDVPVESSRAEPNRAQPTELARADAAVPNEATEFDLAPRALDALERTERDTSNEPSAPYRAVDVPDPRERTARDVAVAQPAETVVREQGNTPADDAARAEEFESGIERELADSLVAASAPERASADSNAPAPREFERPASRELDSPGPTFRPLATAERAEEDEGMSVVTRWEHTPYRSRSGEQKAKAIELHGGSEATEAAVAAGLRYLASHQRTDGNWGRLRDRPTPNGQEKYFYVTVGKTGLSMLAFLGAGHTQDSETEYSAVVSRAIAFLLAMQDDDSGHFGYTTSYSHAIATYALAECYALTSDQRLRDPIERAVAQILRNQVRGADPRFHGGWGYYYPDDREFDPWPRASVTVWQVMALESARLGGLDVPDRTFADARAFLVNCWDAERGAFRYSHDPGRLTGDYPVLPGSTPASMFALSLLGEDIAGRSFRPGRAFLLDRAPRVYRFTGDDDFVFRATGNLYFWYYSTLALFRVGGRPWDAWNTGMKGALLPAQEEDGSWRPISIYAKTYALDTDEDRIYTTTMCVLTLEVYYRYFTPLLKVD